MTDRLIAELTAATGAALVIVGIAVIYWPAALITAGVLLLSLVALAVITDEGTMNVPAPGPPGAGTTRADTDSTRTTRITRKREP